MTAADMVLDLNEHSKNLLLMALLGGVLAVEEAKDKTYAIKALSATANRFGLLDQLRKDSAEFDAK